MKYQRKPLLLRTLESPPSRGAWIEIVMGCMGGAAVISRPPRGGRGLKLLRR